MKIKHIFAAAAVLSATAAFANDDAARTAYFLDGYIYRHNLNPAFADDHGYVSIPVLGNINAGMLSNVGVNTFLYKLPSGQLTTFMSPTVGANEFLDKLKNNNHINFATSLPVISVGFRAFKGYNTISLSTSVAGGVNIPKSLFEFMKLGQTGESSTYSINDMRVKATATAQLALGHSHNITKDIRIGAKLKFILGLGYADAYIDNAQITMSQNIWKVSATGRLDMAAGSGLYVPTRAEAGRSIDRPEQRNQISWDDIDYDSFSPSGFGLGVDLGASWNTPVPGLTVSASVLDLGFVSWSHNIKARTPGLDWSFDGFKDIALDSSQPNYNENKLDEQADRLFDDLGDCFNFQRESNGGSHTTALAATIHLGAEYTMPFYKKLKGGFLFTQHINGPFSWTEGRLSANYSPAKWFDINLSYGQSTYASSLGWMINFHPRHFKFFIGSDHQFFSITPQFLPVGRANTSLTLGLAIGL